MKKALILLSYLIIQNSKAQTNTFPSSGNVGIGTTSPSNKLHVVAEGSVVSFESASGSSNNKKWDWDFGGGNDLNFRAVNDAYSSATTYLNVARSGMTISSVNFPYGNIGIGTTIPATKFETSADGGTLRLSSNSNPNIQLNITKGYTGSHGANDDAVNITSIKSGVTYQPISLEGSHAYINIDQNGTGNGLFTAADFYYNKINFNTYNSGQQTQMTILQGGNVGIGSTSPGAKLEVKGSSGIPGVTGDAFFGDSFTGDGIGIGHLNTNYSWIQSFNSKPLILNSLGNNVGIGTTSPTSILNISVASGDGLIKINTNSSTSNWIGTSLTYLGNEYFSAKGNVNTGEFRLGGINPSGYYTTIYSNNNETMRIKGGNVGIGTTNPTNKLVVEDATVSADNKLLTIQSSHASQLTKGVFGFTSSVFSIQAQNISESVYQNLTLQPNGGNIGIGTTSPSEKLSINGNAVAKKFIVTQIGWSDYVFNEDYKLRSLSNLENFIKQNKHLPEIPSAKEVKEKGISVGDNQALLLKKIEELTLYVIELKKENIEQEKKIQKLLKMEK